MRTQYEYMRVFLLPRMCKGRWDCHGLGCSNSVLLGSVKEAETQESSNIPENTRRVAWKEKRTPQPEHIKLEGCKSKPAAKGEGLAEWDGSSQPPGV